MTWLGFPSRFLPTLGTSPYVAATACRQLGLDVAWQAHKIESEAAKLLPFTRKRQGQANAGALRHARVP